MRPADPCQVAIVTFEGFKAVMDKPIVEDKIDDTIYTDAGAYPEAVI